MRMGSLISLGIWVAFGLAMWYVAVIFNHGRTSFVQDHRAKSVFLGGAKRLSVGMPAEDVFRALVVTPGHVSMLDYGGENRVHATISWSQELGMDNEVLWPVVQAEFTLPSAADAARVNVFAYRKVVAIEIAKMIKASLTHEEAKSHGQKLEDLERNPPEFSWQLATLAEWTVER